MSPVRPIRDWYRASVAAARRLLWRPLGRDIESDVDSYVELLTDEKIARGLEPEAAKREARREVGSLDTVREAVRDEQPAALWRPLLQDMRYAGRLIRRAPGLTTAIVIAMALGIGATSATFSAVDAVLLRPLPFADADRLVVILQHGTDPVSPANFYAWQRSATAFEAMGAAEYWSPNLASHGDAPPEQLLALHLTPEILPLLGATPALGRLPSAGPAGATEVVIADGLWRRRFGADPQIVGRVVGLDSTPHVIVGVMPPTFHFAPFWATRAEMWGGFVLSPDGGGESLRVFAKLRPGVSLARARSEMAAITAALEARTPGTTRQVTVTLLKDKVVGDVRPSLLVLFGAVGCVLVMACANIAHLLLARAATRTREFAVRCAIGATRSRVVRQLLTESVSVAILGGAGGVALAAGGVHLFTTLGNASLPRLDSMRLDGRVVLFASALSVLTGVLFGLAPARALARVDVTGGLRADDRGSTATHASRRARRLLITSQVGFALVLLAGAGLLLRTFVAIRAIDPGFVSDRLASFVVSVAGTAEAAPGRRAVFYDEVLARISALPGVQSVGAINHMPLVGDLWGAPFRIAGRPIPAPGAVPTATFRVISAGYFQTMGIRLVSGRAFSAADRERSTPVVIVNARLAADHCPGESAIGKRLQVRFSFDEVAADLPWQTIIGVSANTVRGDLQDAPAPELFLPLAQNSVYLNTDNPHVEAMTMVVRTTGDPAHEIPAFRSTVRTLAPGVPVSDIFIMRDVVDAAADGTRFTLVLLGAFATVALAMAGLGVFGVVSHDVSTRRRELGIRVALGASRQQVVADLVRDSARAAAAGLAVGLGAAWLLGGEIRSLLFGVTPFDGRTLLVVTGGLAVIAALACLVPALGASRLSVVKELKRE